MSHISSDLTLISFFTFNTNYKNKKNIQIIENFQKNNDYAVL